VIYLPNDVLDVEMIPQLLKKNSALSSILFFPAQAWSQRCAILRYILFISNKVGPTILAAEQSF